MVNLKEVPARTDLYQCFEYALENGYLTTEVCERIMTGVETRTLSSIRSELLSSEGKGFFFSTGKNSQRLVRVVRNIKPQSVGLGKMMDKLFLEESKSLAAHMQSARIIKRRVEVDKKLVRGMRGTVEYEIAPRLARRMREWGVERTAL